MPPASNLTSQVVLGDGALPVWVQLKQGSVWRPTITRTDANGVLEDWPAGTTASVVFTDQPPNPAFSVSYAATVSGPNISWALTVSQNAGIPDGCLVQVYLDQSGNGTAPDLWMSGTVTRVS